ncbi:MAG TPA: fibronectin type III domain-containing protein [Candidatus Paceibacterota bacterium]|nr:fibronectin type III domain-containing protein [Candidatus Paceibacterota bacterium]
MNSFTLTTRYFAGVALAAALLVGGFTVLALSVHAASGTTPPVISGIASTTTDTTATVSWTTDQAGTAQVFYGPTASYGASSSFDNSTSSMSHTSNLGGLLPNTLYHFEVVTANASGTTATSSDMTFMTTNTAATTGTVPAISAVLATPTDTSATITWMTDQNANSEVHYGTTNAYGNSTGLDTANVTSHSMTLNGLTANTTYHFQVLSTGTGTTTAGTSTDQTFTTLAASTTGTGTTGSTTNDMITNLQNQITALTARVTTLEAEVAALMGGTGGGGTGTTTPPTNTSSGTLDQTNITTSAGGTLNFGGRGFPREENITISLNGTTVATVHADGGGNFSSGSLTAPATAGTYTYVFTGSTGDVTHATVTVQ